VGRRSGNAGQVNAMGCDARWRLEFCGMLLGRAYKIHVRRESSLVEVVANLRADGASIPQNQHVDALEQHGVHVVEVGSESAPSRTDPVGGDPAGSHNHELRLARPTRGSAAARAFRLWYLGVLAVGD
jgi:hypothetical protein